MLQLGFLGFLWVVGLGIIVWILSLIRLSLQLKDLPSGSIGISLVAIPVFLLLLSLATYVFVGLIFDSPSESASPQAGKEERDEN
jgi:hypothetical protein